jgi:hypothetical protein
VSAECGRALSGEFGPGQDPRADVPVLPFDDVVTVCVCMGFEVADFPAVGDVPLDGVMADRALIHQKG